MGARGEMRAEIIAVGTELLLGQIVNTNAQYISTKLAEIGIDVMFHSVVGDNRERLVSVVKTAQKRSDIVIFTGGLGPTKDDLTKETIASCIGKILMENEEAMGKIESYFVRRGIPMTENNRRQAQVIENCQVLPNDVGMAPGMAVHAEGVHYILLPGPPKELNPMFDHYAIPYLLSLISDHQVVFSKVLRFFGIGESALEELLMDMIDNQSNPTIAPLAKESEVTIRLTAKAKTVDEANRLIEGVESVIKERAGQFIYGYNDDSLHSVVVETLRNRGLTLSLAESCTGGLISRMITAVPGASSIYPGGLITYSDKVKTNLLGVTEATISQHGAISRETALEMAQNARQLLNTDLGMSITGVAGPESVEGKPVGLVYIGLSSAGGDQVFEVKLTGPREMIQIRAAKYALFYLRQAVIN
jgi:nicotinamide-nucleotide amidase